MLNGKKCLNYQISKLCESIIGLANHYILFLFTFTDIYESSLLSLYSHIII